MINRLKPKSEFGRNVLTLMTGTTIAQAIPIAISPILTRIYTPEDFGIFALFMAIVSVLGSVANGRYELAIMLPKKDEDAINIAALGLIIAISLSFVLFLIVFIFNKQLVNLFDNKEIGFWLYFLPITVFFTGLYNVLNYFNNRKKYYKDLRNATIMKSIILAIVQLSVGFLKSGVTGLISGSIISNMFANMNLLKNITKDKKLISNIKKAKMIALAKKYKEFPKYLILAHAVNSLSGYTHIILFSIFFNTNTVGLLSLCQKLLYIPGGLIARSIGDVFRQEASVYYAKNKECISIYKNSFKKLILISIVPFIILFLTSPIIFSIIFGEKWEVAGEYARILIPMYFLQFITSPLSNMYIVAEKQKLDLYWQIFLLFSVVLAVVISYFLFKSSYISILSFSIAYSIAYITNFIYTYNFAKGK